MNGPDDQTGGLPYEACQRERDDAYRAAYDEWLAKLDPGERARLADLGLDRPSVPGQGTGAPSRDLAESPLASCGPAEIDEPDEPDEPDPGAAPGETPAPLSGEPDPERLHDLLRRLVGELIGQDNARLSLECLALTTGLSYCGDSMTEIARRHGVTRAAVSKRCVELTRALNLKPSRAMRSLQARTNYRRARLRHLDAQN